ncbi:DUF397 domain-containing protein [Streptomyces mobaraensis NBRC 13819 = DSM 40847]|nr:DUF397 domain-containing protein [Streptomyces mobaraensis]QTT73448.1 DUF397 domain-containing protein [Streptomyces mobaraensis NBRC 13819 = DSM 40847]
MKRAPDLTRAIWIKSSHSEGNGGTCVEWAPAYTSSGVVPIRDSKCPTGQALAFPASAWSSFITSIKSL